MIFITCFLFISLRFSLYSDVSCISPFFIICLVTSSVSELPKACFIALSEAPSPFFESVYTFIAERISFSSIFLPPFNAIALLQSTRISKFCPCTFKRAITASSTLTILLLFLFFAVCSRRFLYFFLGKLFEFLVFCFNISCIYPSYFKILPQNFLQRLQGQLKSILNCHFIIIFLVQDFLNFYLSFSYCSCFVLEEYSCRVSFVQPWNVVVNSSNKNRNSERPQAAALRAYLL